MVRQNRFVRGVRHSWQLYLLLALPMAYIMLFSYAPMYGIQIAFKDFDPYVGIMGSPWNGLAHFRRFFTSYQFERIHLQAV